MNEKITKITSVCIGFRYYMNAAGGTEGELTTGGRLYSWCGINGVEYAGHIIGLALGNGWASTEVDVDSAIIEAINQYIVANGTFPALTLRLRMAVVTPEGKSSYLVGVSQAYVSFEYK